MPRWLDAVSRTRVASERT